MLKTPSSQTTNNKDEVEYLELLEQMELDLRYNSIKYMFPKEGPYRKELYPKHIAFMYAGKDHPQRMFSGGNRTGKTNTAAVETVYHLTGDYPEDWEGKVFLNPIKAWASGVTNQSTKEIQQYALLGSVEDIGSGLIPKDKILKTTKKPGVAGAIETVYVKHKSGGISECTFKSYEQGRDNFQGTYKHWIWLDEEPRDYGIYEECLMRTMNDTNPGQIILTFTPLFGLSKVVTSFLKGGQFPKDGIPPGDPSKYVVQVTWDEVPHLSQNQKDEFLKSISPHLRDARTKGIPHLGAGSIYPYSEEMVCVKPFHIPEYWPKAYGLDVGWNKTAAIWAAYDPDSKVIYLFSEHYQGETPAALHASAIKARGAWMNGVIDSGSLAKSQLDGSQLFYEYEAEGLNLELANKAVEAGILRVNQLFASGRLKIFSSLMNLLQEFRVYCRDENGKIGAKQDDHLLDALRYLIMAGESIFTLEPDPDMKSKNTEYNQDDYTGY